MKKLVLALAMLMIFTGTALADRAQYMPDVVLTEPGAVWTDIRGFITDTDSKLFNAMEDAGATQTTILVSEDVTLLEDTVVPANVRLKFTQGSVITLGTYDLTINGYVDAGRYQIFNQNNSGCVTFGITTGLSQNTVAYPEWWGAVHDGTTDDFAEIQAALDSGLKTIELQSNSATGTGANKYLVSAPLVVPAALVTIRGSGMSAAYRPEIIGSFSTSGSITGLIHSEYSFTSVVDITLTFSSVVSDSDVNGIYLKNADGSLIRNVLIVNAYNSIKLVDSQTVNIEDVNLSFFKGSGIVAIQSIDGADGCDDLHLRGFTMNASGIDDCDCTGTPLYGTSGSIYFAGKVPAFVVSDGDMVCSKYSLVMSDNGAVDPNIFDYPSGRFTNVYFDSAYSGALINNAGPTTFTSCWFSTNIGCAGANSSGMYVGVSDSITLTGCEFFNTGGEGITIASTGVLSTVIDGCRFTSIGGAFAYTGLPYAGINVATGVDNITLTDNVFSTHYDFATCQMNYCAYIPDGASYNIVVTGNNFGDDRAAFNNTDLNTYSIAALYVGSTSDTVIIGDNVYDLDESEISVAATAGNDLVIPRSGGLFIVTFGGNDIDTIYGNNAAYFGRGHTVSLLFADGGDVIAGAGIKLAGAANFTATADDVLTLISEDGIWYEVSRSIN
jgi:hypothetical protein